MRWTVLVCVAGILGFGCGKPGGGASAVSKETAAAGAFALLQTEIFVPKCTQGGGCHGTGSAAGGLDLSSAGAYENLVNGKALRRPERRRVAPGDPAASYLLERLAGGGDTPLMPLGAPPLSGPELDRIREWIRTGASK